MKRPLLAGNWKMHGTADTSVALARRLVELDTAYLGIDLVVCPPNVHMHMVGQEIDGSSLELGAQNVSEYASGAFTGEVSANMLSEMGCNYALVGHSERRTLFSETKEAVAEKFRSAQASGIIPVLCIGESVQQRASGLTSQVIDEQINAVLSLVGVSALCRGVIAYEPIWAIGTGQVASAKQAQEVHAEIRAKLGDEGLETRLLYGGSLSSSNAAALFAEPDIDGGLVGGASLNGEEFMEIARLLV
jgi:triosephosphate isomerase